jgi:hypothetical protein
VLVGGHTNANTVDISNAMHNTHANAEDEAIQHAIRASMADMKMMVPVDDEFDLADGAGAGAGAGASASAGSSGSTALSVAAHESAHLLADVVARHRTYKETDEVGLVDMLTRECEQQQAAVAAAVDAALSAGDDEALMEVLAANEALQQALKLAKEAPEEENEEDEVLRLTQGSVEGTSQALVELDHGDDSNSDDENETAEKEATKEESLLDLDFFDQGSFAKDAEQGTDDKTEKSEGVETSKAPGTTPILPDL